MNKVVVVGVEYMLLITHFLFKLSFVIVKIQSIIFGGIYERRGKKSLF
ncbi:hypothetical protein CMALT394_690010 [Carnobacterium maltaromaticum]|nr:hypothetical protein CMALT394_690010 [Carnobacterium maltaromaticum]